MPRKETCPYNGGAPGGYRAELGSQRITSSRLKVPAMYMTITHQEWLLRTECALRCSHSVRLVLNKAGKRLALHEGFTYYCSSDVEFVKKINGKQLAVLNGYTFYQDGKSVAGTFWRCTNTGHFMIVYNSQGHTVAIYDGYTYYRVKPHLHKWRCSTSGYCKGRLITNEYNEIELFTVNHTHPRIKYVIRDGLLIKSVQWVRKKCGKPLAIINQFTFYCGMKSKSTSAWRCTKGGLLEHLITVKGHEQLRVGRNKFYKRGDRGGRTRWCCTKKWCRAALYTIDSFIVAANGEHTHDCALRDIPIWKQAASPWGIHIQKEEIYSHARQRTMGLFHTLHERMPSSYLHGRAENCIVSRVSGEKAVFITSIKGKPLLFHNGYKYYMKKGTGTKDPQRKRWVCSTHGRKGCRASISTYKDVIDRLKDMHNHKPAVNTLCESSDASTA
ncbi:unnamed protein product [Colias eurytheme]|nr:unnamed protein product [Colias eurytheme]